MIVQYEYMHDCIHLKACRRMSKRLKAAGVSVGRGCNEDCTAYIDEESYASNHGLYTEDEVRICIIGACEDGRNGYFPSDLLIQDYVPR